VNYSYSVHDRETKKKAIEVQAVGLCCDREGRDRDSEMHTRFAKINRGRGKEVEFVKIFTKSDRGRGKEVGFAKIFMNFAGLHHKSMFTK
jgi:hypothetical protein